MVSFLIFSSYLSPVIEARARGEMRYSSVASLKLWEIESSSRTLPCQSLRQEIKRTEETTIRVSNSNSRERGVAGLSLTPYNEVIMGNVATTNFVSRVGDILHEK